MIADLQIGQMTPSNETYRVFYRTDASAHYVDLGKQTVEIGRKGALIEPASMYAA